jgi:hypothetical protein
VYLDDTEYRDFQYIEEFELVSPYTGKVQTNFRFLDKKFSEKYLDFHLEVDETMTIPSGFLQNVKGSTGLERENSTNKYADFNKRQLRGYRSASKLYDYRLNSDIKSFYIKLSELSSKCPNLTLIKDVSVKKLEGKGVANKVYALLFYLAQFPDEVHIPEISEEPFKVNWLFDLILEEVIETFLKNPNLQIEGRWFDIVELLSVFGDRNSRMSHLKLKWDKRSFGEIKSRGKSIAHSISIQFFQTEPLKVLGRKRGHSESRTNNETKRTKTPKTRPIRTRSVPFEPIKNPVFHRVRREEFYLDYIDDDNNPDRFISGEELEKRKVVVLRYQARDINNIMLEITRASKQNYLRWLENYKVQLSLREKELLLQIQELNLQIDSFLSKEGNSKY